MSTTLPFAGMYALLSLWLLLFVIVFRHRICRMSGMMAAMTQGMTVGLGMGTLIVCWFPNEYFHATVLTMIIAGVVGAASGISTSIMAVIDGLLSGIMAGMMGTMFMVMIPQIYTITAIKIMAVLCYGISFLLLLMLHGEVKTIHLDNKVLILFKPGFMFAVIVLFHLLFI